MVMTLCIISVIGMVIGVIWLIILNIKKEELGKEEFDRRANAPAIIEVVCFIIFLIFGIGFDSSSSSDDDDYTPKKYEACEAKSDTYHKCSWSITEDRCVCKQR